MHLETRQVPSGTCYGKFTEYLLVITTRDGEGRKVPSYSWVNGWRECIDFMSENANCRLCGISTQYGPWVKWQKSISGYLTTQNKFRCSKPDVTMRTGIERLLSRGRRCVPKRVFLKKVSAK